MNKFLQKLLILIAVFTATALFIWSHTKVDPCENFNPPLGWTFAYSSDFSTWEYYELPQDTYGTKLWLLMAPEWFIVNSQEVETQNLMIKIETKNVLFTRCGPMNLANEFEVERLQK